MISLKKESESRTIPHRSQIGSRWLNRRRLQSLVWYPGLTRAKGPVLIYVEGGWGRGGERSAFVSFKTQGQLIPEAFQFLLIFVKDQQMY